MLYNRTKGVPLTPHVFLANTFLSRALGLMFRTRFDGALIFPSVGRARFHGWFCFFPILLLCLRGNVVVAKHVLKPWRTVLVDCDTVIELDARRKWDVDVGDELIWHADQGA